MEVVSTRSLKCVVCRKASPIVSEVGVCPRCYNAFEVLANEVAGEGSSISFGRDTSAMSPLRSGGRIPLHAALSAD